MYLNLNISIDTFMNQVLLLPEHNISKSSTGEDKSLNL